MCVLTLGIISCNHTKDVLDGKRRIILSPNEAQRKEVDTITFAENDVFGMEILVTSSEEGKVFVLSFGHEFCFVGD